MIAFTTIMFIIDSLFFMGLLIAVIVNAKEARVRKKLHNCKPQEMNALIDKILNDSLSDEEWSIAYVELTEYLKNNPEVNSLLWGAILAPLFLYNNHIPTISTFGIITKYW